MVSLDTTPHITVQQHSHFGSPLFRVFFDVSSLDPINIKSVHNLQVFPICNDIPSITVMIPFPWVSFIWCLVFPVVILWTKEVWVYHTPPAPVQFFPSPSPPFQWVSPQIVSHLLVISLMLLVKETSLPWLGQVSLCRRQHIYSRG